MAQDGRQSAPDWYRHDAALVDIIANAATANVDEGEITTVVAERRFPQSARRRVARVVSLTLERVPARRSVPRTSQPRQMEQKPNDPPVRWFDQGDAEYLTEREFARVLKLALERFGGSVTVEDSSVSLSRSRDAVAQGEAPAVSGAYVRWSRGNRSTSIFLVSQSSLDAGLVGAVERYLDREAPSADERVLVTGKELTEDAASHVSDSHLSVCAPDQLEWILATVALPPDAYGLVLERGEDPTFDWDTARERIPEDVRDLSDIDPFSDRYQRTSEGPSDDSGGETSQPPTNDPEIGGELQRELPDDTVEVDPERLGKLQTDEAETPGVSDLISKLSEE